MYARSLMMWLHERLAERGTFDQTESRFESLRGYNLLPRGRQNAAVRLSNDQIASAILGFAHPQPGMAGHASLILGDLRPVGGDAACFGGAASLLAAVSALVGNRAAHSDLLRLTLSVEQDFKGEEYTALIRFQNNGERRVTSFVSKLAMSLSKPGAEVTYDHDRLDAITALQRSLSPRFFRDLSDEVYTSRVINLPFKTDWQEYETEEEKAEFHRRLGARQSSRFLNLRVDASVTWPREPTRIQFGGHNLVLFPKIKDHAHSISIDLANERISEDGAQSLMNRLLSIMSWCENRPASLHEGWSGNPVPVPVPRSNPAFMTTPTWVFFRSMPTDSELLRCLAYYRDGLNAFSAGLASHAVVSFYRVFETKYETRRPIITWVNSVSDAVGRSTDDWELGTFEMDCRKSGNGLGTYVYQCRVAAAHGARDVRSDPDGSEESRRLLVASKFIQRLARHFIKTEFRFSTSYLADDPE